MAKQTNPKYKRNVLKLKPTRSGHGPKSSNPGRGPKSGSSSHGPKNQNRGPKRNPRSWKF